MSRICAVCLAVLLLCGPAAIGQEKKKGGPATRTVQGQVTSQDDKPLNEAVVYLKNLKTLNIRSFITKADGAYYFHELSPDIDYELRAEWGGASSPVRRLTSFDTRVQAVVNLKVEKK